MVIVGADAGSADAERLARLARRLGAGNVIVRPRVAIGDVAPYLYAADCLIIPPTDEPLRRFRHTVLPMKVFMYLAAGRAILAPSLPDIDEVLTDGETASLVPAGDVRAAAAALTALLASPETMRRLGANCLIAASRYTWTARAARLVEFFERVAGFERAFGRPAGKASL
jgi:glycosyltransferase involved in cell wall biosynthesis